MNAIVRVARCVPLVVVAVLASGSTCGGGTARERSTSVETRAPLSTAPAVRAPDAAVVFDGQRVAPQRLAITSGAIQPLEGGLAGVDAEQLRASVPGSASHRAAMRFTYLGPSTATRPLASGRLVRQVGVRLRYQDTCNVVNVMWRIEPPAGIFVAVKHNPGEATHADCGVEGYLFPRPTAAQPIAPLIVGEQYLLRAHLDDRELRVWVDERLVWQGTLPPEVLAFDGPPGIRADNARFVFELFD